METTTQPPTTTQSTTTSTKSTTTTTKATTTSTTTKPTTTSTTTKPTTTSTTSTTTTVDPRKALEPKVMSLLNRFSALQTAVNSATVQDKTCKDKISSILVAYLASGLKLEDNIYKEPYSKGLSVLTALEGNLKEVNEEWTECLARTTTTSTTEQSTTITTTTESTTTTTECTTTTEAPTTTTEEKRLKESIPEFTIDPPKQEYVKEPNSAQDDEINKQLMEEIKRTEEMIEKQKNAIIMPIKPAEEEPEEEPEPTTVTEATTTTVATTTTTKAQVTPRIAPKPPVTHTKRVVPVTAVAATTTAHPHKHIQHNHAKKFKTLKSTKDKAPAICNESMDLFSGPRYAKSVCVIYKNMTYSAAHDICVKEEMDLFAIQTVDHHLVCRLKMHDLFEKVPSYWINGRYINDLWYYFSSENAGQKRFIYPGTQFNGPHSGNCLRLMKFEDHNTVAASAANCELELPVFCEYYIQ